MGSVTRRVATATVAFALTIAVPALGFSVFRPATAPGRSLYWGAWIGNQFTGTQAPWAWQSVRDFEKRNSAGKRLSVVQWSSPFFSSVWCGGSCKFDATVFEKVRKHGVIPFFSWGSSGIRDRDIAAGDYDRYIAAWARAAKAWGHPFFLRFDWEMNGSWFPWGVGNAAMRNTAAAYVAAWRHVHAVFVANHARNVTWVWCPNVDPAGRLVNLARLYPGNGYVDWTCLDGYNGDDPWTTFRRLFLSTYEKIVTQIAPGKPMILAEVGSTLSGGDRARWISNMFADLPRDFPHIRGLIWFDKAESGLGGGDGRSDWPLERSRSSSRAFAKGVDAPAFATNRFRSMKLAPIPPPRR